MDVSMGMGTYVWVRIYMYCIYVCTGIDVFMGMGMYVWVCIYMYCIFELGVFLIC